MRMARKDSRLDSNCLAIEMSTTGSIATYLHQMFPRLQDY